ncbi:hypothetical protein DFH08DRAFT_801675 [Mycena albidolilacea]|uniref:Uncharacterized protein n=1 Tax=Mycena albidolilacea TaxID=1033008 RepID=A0AAD7AJ46_9AGAR|nr:hypothetical protein DFH08DRAFT_801675 [Mycena albidolilacea]
MSKRNQGYQIRIIGDSAQTAIKFRLFVRTSPTKRQPPEDAETQPQEGGGLTEVEEDSQHWCGIAGAFGPCPSEATIRSCPVKCTLRFNGVYATSQFLRKLINKDFHRLRLVTPYPIRDEVTVVVTLDGVEGDKSFASVKAEWDPYCKQSPGFENLDYKDANGGGNTGISPVFPLKSTVTFSNGYDPKQFINTLANAAFNRLKIIEPYLQRKGGQVVVHLDDTSISGRNDVDSVMGEWRAYCQRAKGYVGVEFADACPSANAALLNLPVMATMTFGTADDAQRAYNDLLRWKATAWPRGYNMSSVSIGDPTGGVALNSIQNPGGQSGPVEATWNTFWNNPAHFSPSRRLRTTNNRVLASLHRNIS